MKNNLLIIGAGIFGLIAKEIAEAMGCYDKIAFIDDQKTHTDSGELVEGSTKDLSRLSAEYSHITIAIGNADVRCEMARLIESETNLKLATLISPQAYVSPSAVIGDGSIIEPMAVVSHSATLGKCALICSGAVINHGCRIGDIVQIDCNATVTGYVTVADKTKITAASVYPCV